MLENLTTKNYKSLLFLFCLIMSFFSSSSSKNLKSVLSNQKLNGNSSLSNSHLKNLNSNGKLSFNDLTVEEEMHTNGHCHGTNLSCNKLFCNGSTEIKNIKATTIKAHGKTKVTEGTISQEVDIHGSLEAYELIVLGQTGCFGGASFYNSQLNSLTIAAQKAYLNNTLVTGDILIKEVHNHNSSSFWSWRISTNHCSCNKPQVLELRGNSRVAGTITFESEGEIHLFDQAEISVKVSNGKVIKK